jgi:hypothetical protein
MFVFSRVFLRMRGIRVNSRRMGSSRMMSPGLVRITIRVVRSALMGPGMHSGRVRRRGSVRLLRQGRLRHKPHQQSQRKPANNFHPLHLSAIVL